MNNSKVAIAVSKTVSLIQAVCGGFITFFFGFGTIMYFVDTESQAELGIAFLIVCLLFVALGIWLIRCSRKKSKLIKAFKKYVTVISCDPTGYIPDIAASLGTSEDVVKKNLDLMMKNKFFSNAYIDRNSNCIVIASKQAVQNTMAAPNSFANAQATSTAAPAVEMVTVKCNSCGGITTIAKGQTGECDYCGSAIKGE